MSFRPLVSVIVPTRDSVPTLRPCLESILAQTHPHVETLVVDRDSADGTPEMAARLGARVLNRGPERSAQRNAGARAARGEWVFFVDSDMVLDPDVVEDCVRSAEVDSAVVVPEVGFSDGLLTRARALEKRCYIGNEHVEAARFFPREAFLALGGYDEDLTAGEDWDLTDRWRSSGGRMARVRATIRHDDRALTLRALMGKRFRYGRLFAMYVRKDPPRALSHLRPGRFFPRRRVLLSDPPAGLVLVALKTLEAVFFGAGLGVGFLRGLLGGRRGQSRTPGPARTATQHDRGLPAAGTGHARGREPWIADRGPLGMGGT